jgi:hypothetical protein
MTKREKAAVNSIREMAGRLAQEYLLCGNLDPADSTDTAIELGKAMSSLSECVYRLSRAKATLEANKAEDAF